MDGTENPVTEKRTVYFECNSGCTLIESMLLLVVVSVILLVAQRPLLEFHRVSISRTVKSSVAWRLSRFFEFAQIWADSSWRCSDFLKWNLVEISTHKLVFKTDRYRDGDLADTREKFPIVWSVNKSSFLKIRKFCYKTLIESIPALQSEIAQTPPQTCIKVTVQVIINAPVQ